MMARFLIALLVTGLSGPVLAQEPTSRERFQMFTNCEPIALYPIIGGEPHAKKIGLTENAIKNAAESRLRAARLYNSLSAQRLFVMVDISERSFSSSVEFEKVLFDRFSSEIHGYATTWQKGMFGAHGGDSGFVLSGVQSMLDTFLANYLRVNEEACN